MLKDAMELLLERGESQADVIIRPAAEPPHVYGVRKPDGTIDWRRAAMHPRHHKAFSLDPIIRVASYTYAREVEDELPGIVPEVWYGPDAITVLFGSRRESSITLPLTQSEPLLKLATWKQRGHITQPDLVRDLKITFRDCLQQAGNLAETIRRVKFQSGTVVDSEVGHGKASLGKEIIGQVTGVGIIPEYVVFNLPVFATPCFRSIRATVECAIDPDPATGSFRVVPLPGQLEAALEGGLASIGDELREEIKSDEMGVPVYYGKP